MATLPHAVRPDPANRSNSVWRPTVVLALLGAATLQLLAAQLDAEAPARQGSGPAVPAVRSAAAAAAFTAPLLRLASGRNLELHFEYPGGTASGTAMTTTGIYYGTNYALYPRRAIVGDGRRVINDDVTLRSADAVPPATTLRDNGVVAVVTFAVTPQGIDAAATRARSVGR